MDVYVCEWMCMYVCTYVYVCMYVPKNDWSLQNLPGLLRSFGQGCECSTFQLYPANWKNYSSDSDNDNPDYENDHDGIQNDMSSEIPGP